MMYAIDSKEKVEYNGLYYHLRIRTQDERNPVVLFLHGGCGSPDRAQVMRFQSPLSDAYTLVAWDQRGAGIAYDAAEAKTLVLTKDVYVEDAHNVVLYLKRRFSKDKIIVVGHSFGSVLGVWLAQKYPDDILAYVGVGQCIDYQKNEMISYKWTLEEAERVGDKKAVKVLKKIGFPKDGRYDGKHNRCLVKQRAILHKLGGATYANRKPYWQELLFHDVPIMKKEYKLSGLIKYVRGLLYTTNSPLANVDPKFLDTVKKLDVPVYLLLGRYDYNCPTELAKQWYEALEAPAKKMILFDSSAHSPQWEEPEKWNECFRAVLDIK